MLTLKRFKVLTDSYGAEPQRWPDSMRAAAEALLRVSPEARQVLAQARELDEAIGAASDRADAPDEAAAALSRLRAGVAARVGGSRDPAGGALRLRWLRTLIVPVAQWSTSARLVGMAAAGGLIIAAGLMLGSMDVTRSPSQVDVLAMLQPDPLPFLADQ